MNGPLAWDRTTYLLLVLVVLDILESDDHIFSYFFLYEYDMPFVILILTFELLHAFLVFQDSWRVSKNILTQWRHFDLWVNWVNSVPIFFWYQMLLTIVLKLHNLRKLILDTLYLCYFVLLITNFLLVF